jgi:hypothetical protein
MQAFSILLHPKVRNFAHEMLIEIYAGLFSTISGYLRDNDVEKNIFIGIAVAFIGFICLRLWKAFVKNPSGANLFESILRLRRRLWKAVRWSRYMPEKRRGRYIAKDHWRAFPIDDPYTEIRKRYFNEVRQWIDTRLGQMDVAERIVFLRELLDKERYALPYNQEQKREQTAIIEKLRSELKKSKKIHRLK